jgi:hypothetical protein
LQTLYTLSDDQTEYQLKDRLSFMRFVGLALHDPVPDAKTIWLYREQLARAGAAERLFARFDALLRAKGWLAMGGQSGNAARARVRSRVEHVFAAQKCRLRLFIRTIGMVRARVKIGLANLAYNFTRMAWLNGRTAPA